MAPIERDTMFHVRMASGERKMLEKLAEEEGVSASDYVRMAIRRAFIERFGAEVAVRSPGPTIRRKR
jgi:hypothetical protein